MKKNLFLVMAAGGSMLFAANTANAQDEVVVVQEEVITTENIDCRDHYYVSPTDNWFLQLGAGVDVPLVENDLPGGGANHHFTAAYNLGFGRWFSPYLGWRLGFTYSRLHWDNQVYSKAHSINANFDMMWDMFNSLGNVNPNRVFSIVPFVGIGGTYNWDFTSDVNIMRNNGETRSNSWTLPVSAGLQLRFRLCRYADFFIEGRASFHGDNFNNYSGGKPIDINIQGIGGFSFNFGGRDFSTYNPCNDIAYLSGLNNQVNSLRSELAACEAANMACQAALDDCRKKPAQVTEVIENIEFAPLMSTVRFTINSDVISNEEMVNVYNVAQWMKANPDANVTITGYADRDTGSSDYNLELSQRRAQAVYDALTGEYGIKGDRLTLDAKGSDSQPYNTNNWNRIVIFSNK